MKRTKMQNGITLVALIITIIVLLILAVVAIQAVTGDGIIQHASNATDAYQQAQVDEAEVLDSMLAKLEQKWTQPYEIEGFDHIKGTWDTGYVIEDEDGNQFVWVPVPDYGVFVADEDFRSDTNSYYLNLTIKDDNNNYTCYDNEEDEDYQNMLKSVKEYGGFYVGAYEACYGDEGQAWSQPHTSIRTSSSTTLTEKMLWSSAGVDTDTIQAACEAYEVDGNVTSLMYGKQWDAICRFIANFGDKKYIGNYTTNYNSTTNSWTIQPSDPWGNLNCNSVGGLISIINENYKANNIYNLLGNLFEITLENTGETLVMRGGVYYNNYGVTCRAGLSSLSSYNEIGFRVAMWKTVTE